MNDSSYIILIDENGTPYIAHSGFGKKAVKYIEKIKDGARTRYFYTKAELDAYLKGKRAEIRKNIATSKNGINSSKSMLGKVIGNDKRQAYRDATAEYYKKNITRDNKLSRASKSEITKNDFKNIRNAQNRIVNDAEEKMEKAKQEYEKTPRAKLDKLLKKLGLEQEIKNMPIHEIYDMDNTGYRVITQDESWGLPIEYRRHYLPDPEYYYDEW